MWKMIIGIDTDMNYAEGSRRRCPMDNMALVLNTAQVFRHAVAIFLPEYDQTQFNFCLHWFKSDLFLILSDLSKWESHSFKVLNHIVQQQTIHLSLIFTACHVIGEHSLIAAFHSLCLLCSCFPLQSKPSWWRSIRFQYKWPGKIMVNLLN